MGVCTKKNCKYPLIAVIACCVCHVVCMMPDLLDPGFYYWRLIYQHVIYSLFCWHMVAQGYINVHRSVGTWLPEKLFLETYQ